uniref:translocation and assembly module lipoprotein TamL n=1 Tax=Leptobacterium flavescens TaxID=472055 RepID=UPI00293BB9FA|nr:BamA/TamA family outer membrane protein [Leptobacterium flavescens]
MTKNTITIDDKKENDEVISNLLLQQPNTSVLSIPLRLHIYNLAEENPDSTYNAWLDRNPKRRARLNRRYSEKQVNELGRYKKGFSNWLKRTGEAPVIIDRGRTLKSTQRLQQYFNFEGYFNNKAHYSIDTVGKKAKRAQVNYFVEKGNAYYLDTISSNIASKELDSIYQLHKDGSFIKQGNRFRRVNFEAERTRLANIFANSGIYRFQPNTSINFNIERDTVAANKDFLMPVELEIDNFYERDGDSLKEIEYKVHTVKKVNIFSEGRDTLNYVDYDNYRIYYKDELKYKPKALTDVVAINPGDVYKESDRSLTTQQISNLRTFKYPNINYTYVDSTDNQLSANIYLSPRPKFSLGFDTDVSHSNIQDFGISFSTSLITRNVFKGAETLEFAVRGSLGSSSDLTGETENQLFNISEVGGDIRLNFPRIFFPLNTDKLIPKYMLPETRISIGTSFQNNIGLDRQSFNNILSYNWRPNAFKRNTLELVNLEFIRNVNIDNFFNVYDNTFNRLNRIAREVGYPAGDDLVIPTEADQFISDVLSNQVPGVPQDSDDFREVRSIDELQRRLTADNLIFASSFTHTRNNRQGFDDNSFSQFRIKLESAGNLLSGIARIIDFNKDDEGNNLVFGVRYSQYVKTEIDYIKYWDLGNDVLAFRSFFGFAVPFGNADNIPFSQSYFGGGSNDNRAWEVYTLGPGTTDNINDFNEANLKIAFNLEYRFNVFGSFKGALFADAGNIWNALDDVENEQATFDDFRSLGELALGTGFGLRYDFNFFVLRFDVGFKTHNPANPAGRRWFREFNFRNAVYNIGINYPF